MVALDLTDVTVYADGRSVWYYDNCPAFPGHAVEVFLSPDRAFESAQVAG